ncbi:hypothetical protein AC578_8113 [Pseudocercospora eumusae]|uniref:Uncharacterized protein n=1 Tax=Pseudocercospora eumusae TaxID=321146 RepID=A0A139H0H9_9PEZI|nr:hypothetical protein AC578_8113 [Pseudocercospora eumusae]
MAPTRQKKNAAKTLEPPSSSDESEQDPSQPETSQSQPQEIPAETLKNFLEKTKQKVLNNDKTRQKILFFYHETHLSRAQNINLRTLKSQKIETSREKTLKQIQKNIEACHRQHKENLHASRQPQIQRLGQLLREKREVERELDRCYDAVELSYRVTLEQVRVAVGDKIER